MESPIIANGATNVNFWRGDCEIHVCGQSKHFTKLYFVTKV